MQQISWLPASTYFVHCHRGAQQQLRCGTEPLLDEGFQTSVSTMPLRYRSDAHPFTMPTGIERSGPCSLREPKLNQTELSLYQP